MTQPDLFSDVAPPAPGKKTGHVPKSSVLAYQALETKDQRVADVVTWLGAYQDATGGKPHTSAELANWWCNWHPTLERLLYIRRGLSDAKQRGLVEHAGSRVCSVSGKTAVTWKVCSR